MDATKQSKKMINPSRLTVKKENASKLSGKNQDTSTLTGRSMENVSTLTDRMQEDASSAYVYVPTPRDFEEYFSYASQQLITPFCYTFRIFKRRRLSKRSTLSRLAPKFKGEEILTIGETETHPLIVISTFYDNVDNLVHLKFEEDILVPREVLKIIAFMLPFHRHLAKITFNGGMAAFTVHELKYFQHTVTELTEICLDNSFIAEANFALLLDEPTQLKNLSLARCKITDEIVQRIFAKLEYSSESSTALKLKILNLSCNRITDEGAKCMSRVLRKNRTLIYLNLSANRMLTDDGALAILDVLKKFPLTREDIMEKRKEHIMFLMHHSQNKSQLFKSGLFTKDSNEFESANVKTVSIHGHSQKLTPIFEHTYSRLNTTMVGNTTYSLGNNVLCCLLLSHCNLSLITIKKLIQVLEYQRDADRRPRGLLHVNIEGNFLPSHCQELDYLEDLLDDQIMMAIHDKKMLQVKSKPALRGKTGKSRVNLNKSGLL